MSGETINIIPGNTLEAIKSIPDKSVHVCIYSPPYWNKRQYVTPVYEGGDAECKHGRGIVCSKCGAKRVDNELGAEAVHDCYGWVTGNNCSECFVCHQRQVAAEVHRVLRDDGTLWINIGDTRSGSGGAGGDYGKDGLKGGQPKYKGSGKSSGLKAKDLCGIPQSLALALRADGWCWRSEIIWAKGVSFLKGYAGSSMPESATDRPSDSHEYILMFSKSAQYYYDQEAVKEEAGNVGKTVTLGEKSFSKGQASGMGVAASGNGLAETYTVPPGRNLRTVWVINPGSNTEYDHYATYPVALIEPIVRASTSEAGCCPNCGAPWKRLVEKTLVGRTMGDPRLYKSSPVPGDAREYGKGRAGNLSTRTLGFYPSCQCSVIAGPATIRYDPVPCTVLDVFSGYGTTGVVAKREARSYTGIELSEKHAAASEKRIASVISKNDQLSMQISLDEE